MDILKTIIATTRKYWYVSDEDMMVKIAEALRRAADLPEAMVGLKLPFTLTLEIDTEKACEVCMHYNDPDHSDTCFTCGETGKGFKPHGHTS